MNRLKKIPQYFSIIALLVSFIISLVKGLTPMTAMYRITVAVICFYILGLCFTRVLTEKTENTENTEEDHRGISSIEEKEEFEELKFTVTEPADED